jgi:hypothetical protein
VSVGETGNFVPTLPVAFHVHVVIAFEVFDPDTSIPTTQDRVDQGTESFAEVSVIPDPDVENISD